MVYNPVMVTIQEIRDYLNRLTPHDLLFKKFYYENGRLLNIEELGAYLSANPVPEPPPSPLLVFDPAWHGNAGSSVDISLLSMQPGSKYNLENRIYFNSYEGISIRKHSNYFPSFCHKHSFMELCIVRKGQCRHQFFPDSLRQVQSDNILMGEKDLLVIPQGIYHAISSLTDSVILNILVKRTAIEKTIARFLTDDIPLFSYFNRIIYENKINSFLLFHPGEDKFQEDLLDQLLLEYCNRPPLYNQIMSQILGLYFSIVQRSHGTEIKVSNITSTGIYYIPKFLLYLQSHYADFSMKKMENHFHLSASYISRIFKSNTGSTVTDTLIRIRLETAKNLLSSTSLLVDDIACHIGYEDTTYFIRLFKARYGLTPKQYQKSMMKGSPDRRDSIVL